MSPENPPRSDVSILLLALALVVVLAVLTHYGRLGHPRADERGAMEDSGLVSLPAVDTPRGILVQTIPPL